VKCKHWVTGLCFNQHTKNKYICTTLTSGQTIQHTDKRNESMFLPQSVCVTDYLNVNEKLIITLQSGNHRPTWLDVGGNLNPGSFWEPYTAYCTKSRRLAAQCSAIQVLLTTVCFMLMQSHMQKPTATVTDRQRVREGNSLQLWRIRIIQHTQT